MLAVSQVLGGCNRKILSPLVRTVLTLPCVQMPYTEDKCNPSISRLELIRDGVQRSEAVEGCLDFVEFDED